MKVITHNGRFHADEVFAIAMVALLLGRVPEVVRTRNMDVINNKKEDDLVIDVGGMYDPKRGLFDHHQATPEVEGFAAAGLVWKEYGREICIKMCGKDHQEIVEHVRENLVDEIDMVDIGKAFFGANAPKNNLSKVIGGFNRMESDESSNEAFKKALFFAVEVLKNAIVEAEDAFLAKEVIQKADQERGDDPVLILAKYVPWMGAVKDDVRFIVFPDAVKPDAWVIQGNKTKHEKRDLLPREWWGLNGEDLDAVVGVQGCTFCHKAGFIMGCSSDALASVLDLIRG